MNDLANPALPQAKHPPEQAIWLLSDGRSGSTWFSRLLAAGRACHIEHEPIHPVFTPALAGQPLLPLPGDAVVMAKLVPLFEAIRCGDYRTWRFGPDAGEGAEVGGLRDESGLILRDIFALLVAPDLLRACPWLSPALILRHPAEVAASKCALPQWAWFETVASFADNAALMAMYPDLPRHIARADTPFARYVLSWAVAHGWLLAHAPAMPMLHYPASRAAALAAVQEITGAAPDPANFERYYTERSPTDRPPDQRGAVARLFAPQKRGPSPAERAWADGVLADFGLTHLFAMPTLAAHQ